MNDTKLQHILDKLRKLTDLQASAIQCGEQGEANAAAAAITRLLKEYDLTLQDIPETQKEQAPIDMEEIPFHFPYMQWKWYRQLLAVVADYNNCKIIRTQSFLFPKGVETTYKVIGRQKHRQVVMFLISFCANQFIQIGKRKYKSWKFQYIRNTGAKPPSLGEYMRSFLVGCTVGLNNKLEEEQQTLPQEKLGALVVANESAINEFLKSMDVRNAQNRKTKVHLDIYIEGQEVGENIQLQKAIKGTTNQQYVLSDN